MFDWLKNPVPSTPPAVVTRDLRDEDWHLRLDLTPQVLSLTAVDQTLWGLREDRLAPTCEGFSGDFISASMLAVKAKLFDDGLYAAAELAALARKQELLTPLVHIAPIAAAASLGGSGTSLSAAAREIKTAFLDDEIASRPFGFYTWSDALRRSFQQDRLLQQELKPSDAVALTGALAAAPAARAAYGDYLDFVARLTNPADAEAPDLRQPGGRWFFPPSRSHESELARRLYGDRPIPDGASLADEMMKRLRDGSLKVEPTDASGWYDFQTWALEPLATLDRMPEISRLRIDDCYREELGELFKAILSLTRETHVKQLAPLKVGAAMLRPRDTAVTVAPELTVEPLPTYYRRRAQGYEFVRRVLDYVGPLHTMHRQTPKGPAGRPLDEELVEMTALFQGAAAVASHELGLEPAAGPETEVFRTWTKAPDVSEDIRMMVPVFFDVGRRKTKVWAILGWATRGLWVSFATPPTVQMLTGRPDIKFGSTFRRIAYPVFAEADVTRLLDRDKFRSHCDRYKTRQQILEHL